MLDFYCAVCASETGVYLSSLVYTFLAQRAVYISGYSAILLQRYSHVLNNVVPLLVGGNESDTVLVEKRFRG